MSASIFRNASWILAAVFLAGCGGGDDEPAALAPSGYNIEEGVVQKGPLLRGSWISINELSPTTLQPTGTSFNFEVADDFGRFKPAAIFTKQHLEATALGYFFDELTGKPSADVVILRSLTDLSVDRAVNINVLTDLGNTRIRSLVTRTTSPPTFSSARSAVQREVLRPFFIYNSAALMPGGSTQPANFGELDLSLNRNADQVLAAISAIVTQIGKTGGGINQFINQFEADLADDGSLNNSPLFAVAVTTQINSAAKVVDWAKVAANLNTFYRTSRYRASDLKQWADSSGGVDRVIDKFKFSLNNVAVGTENPSPEYLAGPDDAAQCFSASTGKLYRNGVAVTGTIKAVKGDKFRVGLASSTPGAAASAFIQRSSPLGGLCPSTVPTSGLTRTLKWTVTSASVVAGRITLDHGGFALLYDCNLRLTVRYEYRLETDTGSAERPSTYKQDPDVPAGCAQQTNTGTYNSVVSGWDRGHLVTSNHMDYDADYILRANYMTNVAPQVASFNQGIWVQAENVAECYRDLAPVAVFGGLAFSDNRNDYFLVSHGVPTPEYWWKVIVTSEVGTGATKVIAWYVPNQGNLGPLDTYLVSVAELETLVGADLVRINLSAALKSVKPAATWSLPAGCSLA